jgi:hypothetical protein
MEKEEAADEHGKSYRSEREDKVPPAHVVGLGTNRACCARVFRDVCPCDWVPLAKCTPRDDKHRTNLRIEAIKFPTGQNIDNSVRRLPFVWGKNSRNNAPSTGRLPPTPSPMHAYSAQTPIQVGPPPAARPKHPAKSRVMLKASRRPKTSEAVPQNEAPRQRPRKSDNVVYLTSVSLTPNSTDSCGKVRATPYFISVNQVLHATDCVPEATGCQPSSHHHTMQTNAIGRDPYPYLAGPD